MVHTFLKRNTQSYSLSLEFVALSDRITESLLGMRTWPHLLSVVFNFHARKLLVATGQVSDSLTELEPLLQSLTDKLIRGVSFG